MKNKYSKDPQCERCKKKKLELIEINGRWTCKDCAPHSKKAHLEDNRNTKKVSNVVTSKMSFLIGNRRGPL